MIYVSLFACEIDFSWLNQIEFEQCSQLSIATYF